MHGQEAPVLRENLRTFKVLRPVCQALCEALCTQTLCEALCTEVLRQALCTEALRQALCTQALCEALCTPSLRRPERLLRTQGELLWREPLL